MARPTKYKNASRVHIRLDQSLLVRIDALAERHGLDRTGVINWILRRELYSEEPMRLGSISNQITDAINHELAADPPAKYKAKPAQDAAS